MSHYRAFISSLLHTSREGKESLGKGEWSPGKLGRGCIPEGRKHTFFILLLQTDVPHRLWEWKIQTQQARKTGFAGRGFRCTGGWPDDFTAAPRGSSFKLVQTGPRAAWLLVGWYGQVGHGSSEALFCLPDLSRVPVCVCDAEGMHSVLLNPLWVVCLGGA